MAKTFRAPGNNLTFVAPANLTAGQGLVLGGGATGGLFVVADATVLSGQLTSGEMEGVHELPKLSTDVMTLGLVVYWDVANARCTLTAAAGHLAIGKVAAPAGSGATSVEVKLLPGLALAVVPA